MELSVLKSAASGIVSGLGSLVRDVRAAWTGKEIVTAEQQAAILERADKLIADAQDFEHKVSLGQIELNKLDAQSGSLYKGGWRPGLGWICVCGLGYSFLISKLLPWIVAVVLLFCNSTKQVPPMPVLDIKELMSLTGALLGFGWMRMQEKKSGVASK